MSIQAKRRLDYKPPHFLINEVNLDVSLHPTNTRVISVLKVSRNGSGQEPLVLDGEGLELKVIKINGQQHHEYHQNETNLVIHNVPDVFDLNIEVVINPEKNTALEGLYLANGVFCTQCEAEGFRRITYFLDRPDVLSIYTVRVQGDKQSLPFLLSNGNPIAKGECDNGQHYVQWHDPFPKPCYLFALVAGDFDLLSDSFTTQSGRKVALELYVDKGKKARGVFALEALKRSMAWDEEVFGLEYDLDIYMIVAVDFFNMGAMENKGLNVFNSKFVLADQATATDDDFFNVEAVIAHEYFHNWTGNRVTCRDWFQLSLKEGLTVFRDQQFSADMTSALSNRIKHVRVMREHQFAEDASAMSHPIRPDEVIEMNNFYTVTVYDKGAEVIRMLHTLLGECDFRKGMDIYFERHDGQAVTCDDFVAAMQAATTIDLTQFSRWYSQSGTPEISVGTDYNPELKKFTVTLQQHTPATADQAEKHNLLIPIKFECIDEKGNRYQDTSKHHQDGIVLLTDAEICLEYEGVNAPLLPVVLGNFSAPARVNNSLSVAQLIAIFQHAEDSFSRWDALQQFYDWCISQYQKDQPEAVTQAIWQTFTDVIQTEMANFELLGECLVIPSFETLCQSRTDIDVIALNSAREQFALDFATHLQDALLAIYHATQTESYCYEQLDVQKRRCANVALAHLARLKDHHSLVADAFTGADNMTDTLGALKAAQQIGGTLFDDLMQQFEQTWQHDALVLDKWFALHATSERRDILSQITLLREHPQFAMSNPNRVRSLLGSFSFYNPLGFHATNGSGYKFVTDYLLELDQSNPQVAARIVTPLTQWQRFAKNHQALMKAQLARLLNHPSLSKDLFEKVSKSLAYDDHSSD